MIPHAGGLGEAEHWIFATPNAPWAELFLPAPGGPPEVYRMHEEQFGISRGPEGIYMRPSDRPGFGKEIEVTT